MKFSSRTVIRVIIQKVSDTCEAPHVVEKSPAGVACNPRYAVRDSRRTTKGTIESPADDQPPPRQEGEAMASPWYRQVRDGTGAGGGEQLNA